MRSFYRYLSPRILFAFLRSCVSALFFYLRVIFYLYLCAHVSVRCSFIYAAFVWNLLILVNYQCILTC